MSQEFSEVPAQHAQAPLPAGQPPSAQQPPDVSRRQPRTGRQAYNLVTDTVAGPNLRWRDNLDQGLAILASVVLGALIGFFVVQDQLLGAIAGGFVGLLAGTFVSGLFLMIYRGVKHARGQHD